MIIDQFTPAPKRLVFTKKCREKMERWGLSEEDVKDVFFHGQEVKKGMMQRKYYGYEVGMIFFRDKKTGDYVASSAWKRLKQ